MTWMVSSAPGFVFAACTKHMNLCSGGGESIRFLGKHTGSRTCWYKLLDAPVLSRVHAAHELVLWRWGAHQLAVGSAGGMTLL